MDANIDPALVEDKMPKAPSAAAEEWKYAQNQTWPSQLTSTNGQGESLASSREGLMQ